MKLKNKILIAFLAVGLFPLLLFGYFTLHLATSSLEKQSFSKLEAVREIKKTQIEEYFEEREADIIMLQHAVKALIFDKAESIQDEILAAKSNAAYFKHYIEVYGYDDLLIINPKGEVFFSVAKLADYQSNVLTGPFEDSGLGRIFKRTLGIEDDTSEVEHEGRAGNTRTKNQDSNFHIEDFSPYAASNNKPEAFISYPIEKQGVIDSVIILKLSIDHINGMMQKRAGMGDTGETYLIGSDHRMRSDSFLDPIGHSVNASFTGSVRENGVLTDAAKEAVKGISNSKIIVDYNGNLVLSSYTPLQVHDLKWALIAEIDEAEAISGVIFLKEVMILVLSITSIFILLVTYRLVISITKPIGGEPNKINDVAQLIASGNLTSSFDKQEKYSGIYGSIQKMNGQLNCMIGNISQVANVLSAGASQCCVAAEQVNITLNEQQESIEKVACAMNEMTVTIKGVSDNAQQVADSSLTAKGSSAKARTHVKETIGSITRLSSELESATGAIQTVDSKSEKIGAILEVIRGIADQTNLLALNAAIEAARAGEQGRGFSVVADEVRQLAHKTQLSTTDIEDMIKHLQSDVKDVVAVINRSNDIVIKAVEATKITECAINRSFSEVELISDNAAKIATAALQQSSTTDEINQSLISINVSAKQNAQGMGEISASSGHINQQSKELKALSGEFITT